MLKYPSTLEEARKVQYGRWAGMPKGHWYEEGNCAYEVFGNERGSIGRQCQHKNGYGANNLYCKQHAQQLGMIEAPKPKPRRMSHGDYLACKIDEQDKRIKELEGILSEWLHDGRFLVGNTPEEDELVKRTKEALGE